MEIAAWLNGMLALAERKLDGEDVSKVVVMGRGLEEALEARRRQGKVDEGRRRKEASDKVSQSTGWVPDVSLPLRDVALAQAQERGLEVYKTDKAKDGKDVYKWGDGEVYFDGNSVFEKKTGAGSGWEQISLSVLLPM